MPCPLCSTRPAKRRCPALHQDICAVCCGTKRLVEIRCPDDCAYLASARRHPAATVQRQHELDVALLLPAMAGSPIGSRASSSCSSPSRCGTPRTPCGRCSTPTSRRRPRRRRRRWRQLRTVSSTNRAATALNAQQLGGRLRTGVRGDRQQTQGPRTPLERDAAKALRGIEDAARRVGPIAGDIRTGYLGLIRRILGGPNAPAAERSPEPGPSIILP